MLKTLYLTTSILLICNTCNGQLIRKNEATSINQLLSSLSAQHKPENYIIRNVNILTMLDSVLLTNQDILISQGRIRRIGKEIIPETELEVIDGTGKYCMPGLTDMHVHLFYRNPLKNLWLMLLLTNGVTTVRDMAGDPGKVPWKEKINRNEILGPTIYQASPLVNGLPNQFGVSVASSVEDGRDLVRTFKKEGYDFIKVYDDLESEVFHAIVDEAEKESTNVIGHIPKTIPLADAVKNQSTVEHLTGYKNWNNAKAYLEVDNDYAEITANSNVWNCPTFYNLMINWGSKNEAETLMSEISPFIPENLRKRWTKMLNKNVAEKTRLVDTYGESNQRLFSEIVINLYKAEAKLIAGTDAGNLLLLIPGITLHKELELLNKTGIPIYDVLKMTTINAALAMNQESEFGTVEVGKRADLLLLEENPLEDLANLKNKSGIMIRGIWLSASELDNISVEIKTIFGNN